MKIALCLSGQPRFYKKGYECFEQYFLSKNPSVDVFYHAWYDPNAAGSAYESSLGVWNKGMSDLVEEKVDENLLKLYRPKIYIVEPQKNCTPQADLVILKKIMEINHDSCVSIWTATTPLYILSSMFYSLMISNHLKCAYEKENGFEYDIVIRARFDCGLLSPLIITENDTHFVNIPDVKNNTGIWDWLFFSSSKNMDIIANLYHTILDYINNEGVIMRGEELLLHHLIVNHLPLRLVPLSLFLIRDSEFKDRSTFGRYLNSDCKE